VTNSIPQEAGIDQIYKEVVAMLGNQEFCKTTLTDGLLAPYANQYRRISEVRTMLLNRHRGLTRPETRKKSRKGKYIGKTASRPRKGHNYAVGVVKESTFRALWV